MTRTGHLFSWIALAEAFTWAGLLIGMFVKYVLAWTEWGVWLFGRLHGGAFLIYCAMTIVAAIRLRWPWWATILAFVASIPPLATLPLERWFRRRGWLAAPPVPAA